MSSISTLKNNKSKTKKNKKKQKVKTMTFLEVDITDEELKKQLNDDKLFQKIEDSISEIISQKAGYCHKPFVFIVSTSAELDK